MDSKTLIVLVKAFFRGTKPFTVLLERLSFKAKSTSSKLLKAFVLLALVVVFGYLVLLLGLNYYSYQMVGLLMGFPYLGLFFAAIAGFVLVLILSLSSVTTTLYQSKDVMMLRSLAIDEKSLVLSRLIFIYLLHAPLYYILTIPALVVAFWVNGFSPLYLTGSLLFLVLGPILPLCLSVAFSIVLIRLTKGRRFRTIQELSSMILFVVFIVGMSASMARNMGDTNSLLDFNFEVMIATLKPILSRLETIFPLFVIQANMLFSASRLMLFILITCAVLLILLWYLPARYSEHISFLLSNQQSRTTSHKEIKIKKSSCIKALIRREIVIIRTHSVFTFELAGELLIPLLLIAIYAATGVLDEISVLIEVVRNVVYLPQLIFLLFLLVANFCMLSSTSVSRQGSLFILDRQYPIQPKTFVQSKVILHLLLVFLPNVLYLSAALYFMQLSFIHLLYFLPLSFLAIFTVANFQLGIDYHRPNLEWTLPQQAMKSNVNGLLGMLAALILEVVLAILLLGASLLGLPFFVGPLLAGVVLLSLAPVSYRMAVSQARQALSK